MAKRTRTIRVAMVTDHPDEKDKVDGGVQGVTQYLVSALVMRSDIDLHVISFRHATDHEKVLECDGYTRYILPGSRWGALTGYWRDQRTLNECLSRVKPDLVHGQGVGQHGILAVRCHYPSVLTIHGILTEEARHLRGMANKLRHKLISIWSEYYCVRKARHMIIISPYVSKYFRKRLSGEHHLIPNPISDAFFAIQRRPEYGRILFVGRLRALKGVSELVQSISIMAQTHDVKLVLAGSMEDEQYVEELRRLVHKLRLDNRVEFCGLLEERELHDALARCSVMVLPSRQETAPMVIAEAMAAGVPVVATKVGGIPYQVREGATGFMVEPGDIASLASRTITLITDREMIRVFGNAGKVLASRDYSADDVARRTFEVYQRVLD